jgi:hypothetical protein
MARKPIKNEIPKTATTNGISIDSTFLDGEQVVTLTDALMVRQPYDRRAERKTPLPTGEFSLSKWIVWSGG